MNRERLAQIAVRLYPDAGRAERSDELVGTLLDASDDSRVAFARQLRSVVAAGLEARSRVAVSKPLGQIGINALAWAAVMVVVQLLVGILGFEVRSRGAVQFPAGQLVDWVLPVVILALFTLRRTRLSGLAGLIFVGYGLLPHVPLAGGTVAVLVLPLTGFALLAFAPQKVSPRGRWVWLAPAAVFAFFAVTSIGYQSGVAYIAPVVVTICFLPFNPSFAMGTVLVWSALAARQLALFGGTGRGLLLSVALLACTPIAVIASSVCRRATRRT